MAHAATELQLRRGEGPGPETVKVGTGSRDATTSAAEWENTHVSLGKNEFASYGKYRWRMLWQRCRAYYRRHQYPCRHE